MCVCERDVSLCGVNTEKKKKRKKIADTRGQCVLKHQPGPGKGIQPSPETPSLTARPEKD